QVAYHLDDRVMREDLSMPMVRFQYSSRVFMLAVVACVYLKGSDFVAG
ncbi:MAG: hypothetical protein RLZ37_1820, partial [Actinomycetota bacterium]